ncbi:TetR family transcriptional regulator [Nocardiopsis mangrovi]|uniref:TetR family transcriptional regulator n=1 Tax=Nocardiopsis mangrovi TaxID=1179818 RepID=A0ABV9DU02_9ACTN
MGSLGEGLRDRRRRETRREIHVVALRLAREHGFHKVTVEMISAGVGISPRTFFNYFPSKESAVVEQPPAELSPDLVARFVEGGPGRPRDVLTDLTRLLIEQLAQDPPERSEVHDVFELAHSAPTVFAALMARFDASRLTLAATVAQRMDPDTDEQVPDLIASVAMTAVRSGMERWSQDTADDRSDSPVLYVQRAVTVLEDLLAPGTHDFT